MTDSRYRIGDAPLNRDVGVEWAGSILAGDLRLDRILVKAQVDLVEHFGPPGQRYPVPRMRPHHLMVAPVLDHDDRHIGLRRGQTARPQHAADDRGAIRVVGWCLGTPGSPVPSILLTMDHVTASSRMASWLVSMTAMNRSATSDGSGSSRSWQSTSMRCKSRARSASSSPSSLRSIPTGPTQVRSR